MLSCSSRSKQWHRLLLIPQSRVFLEKLTVPQLLINLSSDLLYTEVHCFVQKSWPIVHILNQRNTDHVLELTSIITLLFHPRLRLSSILFLSKLATKISTHFLLFNKLKNTTRKEVTIFLVLPLLQYLLLIVIPFHFPSSLLLISCMQLETGLYNSIFF